MECKKQARSQVRHKFHLNRTKARRSFKVFNESSDASDELVSLFVFISSSRTISTKLFANFNNVLFILMRIDNDQ